MSNYELRELLFHDDDANRGIGNLAITASESFFRKMHICLICEEPGCKVMEGGKCWESMKVNGWARRPRWRVLCSMCEEPHNGRIGYQCNCDYIWCDKPDCRAAAARHLQCHRSDGPEALAYLKDEHCRDDGTMAVANIDGDDISQSPGVQLLAVALAMTSDAS